MAPWSRGGAASSTDPGRAALAPGSSVTLRHMGGTLSATELSRNTAPAGPLSARSSLKSDDASDQDTCASSLSRATFLLWKKKADALLEENTRLQAEYAALQAHLRREREVVDALNRKIRESEVKHTALIEEVSAAHEGVKAQRQRGDRLEALRNELEESLMERETDISNAQMEKTRLNLEMEQAAKLSSHNIASAKHLAECVHRLESEKLTLQSELEQQRAIAAEKDRIQNELSAVQAQLQEQRDHIARLVAEVCEAEAKQGPLEEQVRELRGREEAQRSRWDDLEALNGSLQESLVRREEEHVKLAKQLSEASRQHTEDVATLQELDENIRLLQKEKQALQHELQQQAAFAEENLQLQARVDELQEHAQAQREQMDALSARACEAEARQAALKEEAQEACVRGEQHRSQAGELQKQNGTLEASVAQLRQFLDRQAMEKEELRHRLQEKLAEHDEAQRKLTQAMEWYSYLSQQVETLREAKLLEAINKSVNIHIAVPKVTLSYTNAPQSSINVAEGVHKERIQNLLEEEIFCHFEPLWVSLDAIALAPDGTSKQAYSTRMLARLTEAVKGYMLRCQQADLAAAGPTGGDAREPHHQRGPP